MDTINSKQRALPPPEATFLEKLIKSDKVKDAASVICPFAIGSALAYKWPKVTLGFTLVGTFPVMLLYEKLLSGKRSLGKKIIEIQVAELFGEEINFKEYSDILTHLKAVSSFLLKYSALAIPTSIYWIIKTCPVKEMPASIARTVWILIYLYVQTTTKSKNTTDTPKIKKQDFVLLIAMVVSGVFTKASFDFRKASALDNQFKTSWKQALHKLSYADKVFAKDDVAAKYHKNLPQWLENSLYHILDKIEWRNDPGRSALKNLETINALVVLQALRSDVFETKKNSSFPYFQTLKKMKTDYAALLNNASLEEMLISAISPADSEPSGHLDRPRIATTGPIIIELPDAYTPTLEELISDIKQLAERPEQEYNQLFIPDALDAVWNNAFTLQGVKKSGIKGTVKHLCDRAICVYNNLTYDAYSKDTKKIVAVIGLVAYIGVWFLYRTIISLSLEKKSLVQKAS